MPGERDRIIAILLYWLLSCKIEVNHKASHMWNDIWEKATNTFLQKLVKFIQKFVLHISTPISLLVLLTMQHPPATGKL